MVRTGRKKLSDPQVSIESTPIEQTLFDYGYTLEREGRDYILKNSEEKTLLLFKKINDATAKKIRKIIITPSTTNDEKREIDNKIQEQFALLHGLEKFIRTALRRPDAKEGPLRYFTLKDDGTPNSYLPEVMLNDILENHPKIITFIDTEETWIYDDKKKYYIDCAEQIVKQFMKDQLADFFKKSHAEETIYQLKILTYVDREKQNPPPEYLNLKNGLLDVSTRTLLPHADEWFFINCAPTIYDPSAEAPIFKNILVYIACPKEKTLQEFCGSILINTPKYKKAGFLYGPTDAGKTVFADAIAGVFGLDCVSSVPLQKLENRFQSQRIYGKKINMCGDLGGEAFTKIGIFKRTTGGDIIEAEVKGINKTIKFIWGGKHLFDANDLPPAVGEADTDAFYNRLHLFSFPNKVPKKDIDRSLRAQLATDKERSGILNWMLDGLERLEKNQEFSDKTSIDEIRDYYKRASDNVYCFAQDRCEVKQDEVIEKSVSRREYVQYCVQNGFSAKGRSTFYSELDDIFPTVISDRVPINKRKPHCWRNLVIYDGIQTSPNSDPRGTPIPPGTEHNDEKNGTKQEKLQ